MSSTTFSRSLLLLAVLPLCFGAEPVKKIASVEGITEYQLDNGLRVLLFPDQSRPRVTVNMTVLVGSRHEGYGESGMAHLLEHMVFKGTPTQPTFRRRSRSTAPNSTAARPWIARTTTRPWPPTMRIWSSAFASKPIVW